MFPIPSRWSWRGIAAHSYEQGCFKVWYRDAQCLESECSWLLSTLPEGYWLHLVQLSSPIYFMLVVLKDEIEELLAFEDLSNDEVAFWCFIELVNLEDVGMVQSFEHFNFLKTWKMTFSSFFDGLQRSLQLQHFMFDTVNCAEGAFPYLPSDNIVLVKATHPAHHKILAIDAQSCPKCRSFAFWFNVSLHFLCCFLPSPPRLSPLHR